MDAQQLAGLVVRVGQDDVGEVLGRDERHEIADTGRLSAMIQRSKAQLVHIEVPSQPVPGVGRWFGYLHRIDGAVRKHTSLIRQAVLEMEHREPKQVVRAAVDVFSPRVRMQVPRYRLAIGTVIRLGRGAPELIPHIHLGRQHAQRREHTVTHVLGEVHPSCLFDETAKQLVAEIAVDVGPPRLEHDIAIAPHRLVERSTLAMFV